jgi:drug/metabolite transporter (DMT)-like permease
VQAPDGGAHMARGYLLAMLAAACWATGGLMAKWLFLQTGYQVGASDLSGARAVIAFAMVLAYVVVFKRRDLRIVPRRDLPFLATFGVLGLAMVHFTYFMAIERTNVPTAILLEYLAPILVLVVSVLFLGERFTFALPAGVVLSVTGCALVVGAIGGGGLKVSPSGIAWGLASAVFFAGYTVMGKYATGRFSPWTLLCYGLGAATVFWLVVLGGPASMLRLLADPTRLAVVTTMAFVSTVVPFSAFLHALTYIDATKASITATLEPVLAGIAVLFIPAMYQPMSALQLAGAALVLAAVVVAQGPGLVRQDVPPAP